jgi:hypothetical protein
MSSDKVAALAAWLDGLIPGDPDRWPPFSAAVSVIAFAEALGSSERQALDDIATMTAGLSGPGFHAAIKAWEQATPDSFAAMLGAAHGAYYTAPAVIEVVTALANEGPREPTWHFDPTLVTQVVTTGAGKRRL